MKAASSNQRRDSPLPPIPPEVAVNSNDPIPRPGSSNSGSSSTSDLTSLNVPKRSLYELNQQAIQASRRSSESHNNSANSSNTSLPGYLRPQNDSTQRKISPLAPSSEHMGHRPRQHSQGFFEPSLPTASQSSNTASLSASRIAAQAAMQHQNAAQNLRNRSQTIPPQESGVVKKRDSRESPPPLHTSNNQRPAVSPGALHYQNGVVGGRSLAAATAANIAFPRTPSVQPTSPTGQDRFETGHKQKGEKSKMKLFSKPKHMGISRDKDSDKREKPFPSPNKLGLPGSHGLSRMVNASTTSLNDPMLSNNSSMYTLPNSSAATVVPAERPSLDKERDKDKEKHKHNFLSRQKLKLKDKDDHFHLPLSSANSNSRPLDPSAPQSLYSFAPSSPVSTSFTKSMGGGKSMSGLDLRHGGRALREKKKEVKASAAVTHDANLRDMEHQSEYSSTPMAGSSSATLVGGSSLGSAPGILQGNDATIRELLQGFGLHNMTPDDVWDFLKAKLLILFEGEDIRIALEDLNKLVSIHLQRCVRGQMPSEVVQDLRDLLQTGFASLNHSIYNVPDENLVPYIVNLWTITFGTILPFIQAVFLPLDLEFKGRGSIMSSREAKEFWGALPNGGDTSASVGDELDVRNIVLISFRDTIILTRYEMLKATFSRLSLEKINANLNGPPNTSANRGINASRPSTSSAVHDQGFGSYNSQSSYLNVGSSFSSDSFGALATRARASSNTSSNPEQYSSYQSSYSSFPPRRPSISDPSDVTETAGRMLQCISVLASVQTDDEAQQKVEELSKVLKHNWLGRGRTGRDRRGFVGTKIRPPPVSRKESDQRRQHHLVDGVMGA